MTLRSRPLAGIIAAAALVFASPMLMAQGMGEPGMQQQQQGQGQGQANPQMEMQQLQQELATIQQQAIENNPELEEKGDSLEVLVMDKMEAAGYEPRRDLETLEGAQEQLQDSELSAEERQSVIESEDVQQAQTNLQEAQQAVADDEEIQDAQTELREELMDAMRTENPDVDELLSRLQSLQQQMQQGGMR
ncbi:MAG: hypothetical protein ACQETK_07750 [Pseudomonadota bacterium]